MQANVLAYLEERAQSTPNAVCVEDDVARLSFNEVKANAEAVGTALIKRRVNDCPVGVYMKKSTGSFCAVIGIVFSGACYSYLNPDLPQIRLSKIVSVLKPKAVICSGEDIDEAAALFPGQTVLAYEDISREAADYALLAEIKYSHTDTKPLYINFTSGSTGEPKGIAVSHRSVIDFIDAFTELFNITQDDVLACQAPFDFDVSVKDIYSCLKTGARLVLVRRELFSAPAALADFLCEKQITTMIWAVSALCLLSTFHALDYKTPKTVNKILFSGEVMPQKVLKDFIAHLPDAMFVNLYGPTEITCNCTYHILEKGRDYSGGIPIGRHFPNESVFLLDEDNRLIEAPKTVGEICVNGSCLALGYYNNREQTSLHFVQNPLNSLYPETIYRTGDLAELSENGELYFVGRKDFQIKYMGHRIELEEIERVMGAIDGVDRCCCLFFPEKSKLKGYYVGTVDKKELYAQMQKLLPVFMIPGSLINVEAFPLTKNGKTDRKALAEIK